MARVSGILNHERIGTLEAKGAPIFKEIGLFTVPEDFALDPTKPWELQLRVQRATGAREKASLTFNVTYSLPERYMKSQQGTLSEIRRHRTVLTRQRLVLLSRWSLFGSRCGGEFQDRSASLASPSSS